MLNYDSIRDWWDNQAKNEPGAAGTTGIAGGGEIEAIYRDFMEHRHFRKLVRLNKEMTVLEMGCGAGRWALALAPRVKKIIAVDVSPEMISLARKRQQTLGIENVEFCVQPIQDFTSEYKFDVIYFSGVLQYIDDNDVYKVLQTSGKLLENNAILIDRSTTHEPEREIYRQGTYVSVYRTVNEIQELFARAGFCLKYHASSYRLMRMAWLARVPKIGRVLSILTRLLNPVSSWVIFMESWLLDRIKPIPSQQGPGRLHQFFVFSKNS